MKKDGEEIMDLPVHIRMTKALMRGMETFALGIYAVCALAVAMDWGLESVLPIEEWTDRMNDEQARRGAV